MFSDSIMECPNGQKSFKSVQIKQIKRTFGFAFGVRNYINSLREQQEGKVTVGVDFMSIRSSVRTND